ncbi:Hypothetical predicted protein [Mytilus galloprovincialis]|uniref:Uncharacterized protein n=1 Tax=Mytilus galloprovincialis TaxID=29158 RepID=A0A8B6FIL1_MYTGA|nr:Hypothetical predicted protein [Mytilus galloprovincialis]
MNYIRETKCSDEFLRPKTDRRLFKTTCSQNEEFSLFKSRTFIEQTGGASIKSLPPRKITPTIYFTTDPHVRKTLLHFEIKFFYGRDDRFKFPVVTKRPHTPRAPAAYSWNCSNEAFSQMYRRQRNRHLISPVCTTTVQKP